MRHKNIYTENCIREMDENARDSLRIYEKSVKYLKCRKLQNYKSIDFGYSGSS